MCAGSESLNPWSGSNDQADREASKPDVATACRGALESVVRTVPRAGSYLTQNTRRPPRRWGAAERVVSCARVPAPRCRARAPPWPERQLGRPYTRDGSHEIKLRRIQPKSIAILYHSEEPRDVCPPGTPGRKWAISRVTRGRARLVTAHAPARRRNLPKRCTRVL